MNTTQPYRHVGNVKVNLPGREYAQHVTIWTGAPPYVVAEIAAGRHSNVTGVRRGDHNEIRWTIRALQRVAGAAGMADAYRFYVLDRGDQWLLNVDHASGAILYGMLLVLRQRRAAHKGYKARLRAREERDERRRGRRSGWGGSRSRSGEYYVE